MAERPDEQMPGEIEVGSRVQAPRLGPASAIPHLETDPTHPSPAADQRDQDVLFPALVVLWRSVDCRASERLGRLGFLCRNVLGSEKQSENKR